MCARLPTALGMRTLAYSFRHAHTLPCFWDRVVALQAPIPQSILLHPAFLPKFFGYSVICYPRASGSRNWSICLWRFLINALWQWLRHTQVLVKQAHKKTVLRAGVPGGGRQTNGKHCNGGALCSLLRCDCFEDGLFIFPTTAHLLSGRWDYNKLHCRRAHCHKPQPRILFLDAFSIKEFWKSWPWLVSISFFHCVFRGLSFGGYQLFNFY